MSERLRVLDLFSGIGGYSLGLERTGGFETVAFCEIEDYPVRNPPIVIETIGRALLASLAPPLSDSKGEP